MGISEPIDAGLVERILAPLEDGPCGTDLRLDLAPNAVYSALRDARSEARAAERLSDNDPTAPVGHGDWHTVERLSSETLASRSKDIEVASWLMESLTRIRGLEGLAEGAEILAGLVERFWDKGLFPGWDEEDPAYRLATITGLSGQDRDGTLLQPLRRIALFDQEDGTPVTLWQYDRARNLASLGDQGKPPQSATPVMRLDALEHSARHQGRATLLATRSAASRAVRAWRSLEAAIATIAMPPEATPSTGRVLELLDEIVMIANRYLPVDPSPEAADMQSAGDAPPGVPIPDARVQASMGRDAMLDDVLRIAGIFRVREPTSPFSYTLEDAVRRARMSWLDLLLEVIPDDNARTSVLNGLGIKLLPDQSPGPPRH